MSWHANRLTGGVLRRVSGGMNVARSFKAGVFGGRAFPVAIATIESSTHIQTTSPLCRLENRSTDRCGKRGAMRFKGNQVAITASSAGPHASLRDFPWATLVPHASLCAGPWPPTFNLQPATPEE